MMPMKSTWVWAGFAAAIILMVTVGILQVKPQKTVLVGFDAPLSARAAFDPSEQDATVFYLEQNPNSRLKPQGFFYEFDSEQARGLYVEAQSQSIPFFITTQPSSLAVDGIELFNSDATLMINTSSTTLAMSNRDDFILRIIPDLGAEQTAIADHLKEQPERRLLVLQDSQNATYTDPAFEVFATEFLKDDRKTITRERFSFVNFSTADHIQAISEPHDALYILAGDFQAAIGVLAQLFHRINPDAPIYLTPWASSGAIFDRIGPAKDKVTVFTHHRPEQTRPAVDAFYSRFIDRFGYQPNGMAVKITIALELLEQAVARGHTTPAAAKRYMLNQGTLQTSLGSVTFNAYGDNQGAEFIPVPLPRIIR
ncbi:ABC transporter substrate-binding protein [Spiribacter salilacus]|nr:ABC transporter substrate-binding protein [Spiribacter salilacus]